MKEFEYNVKEIPFRGEDDLQKELNFIGKNGWELVSIQWFTYEEGETPQVLCFFKREK